LLVLVLVCVVAGCGSKDVTYAPVKTAGNAPPFSLKTVDGKPLSAAAHWKAKPVVVAFFASWCSKCATQQDNLKKVLDDYGDAIDVIGVAGQEDPATVKAWADKHDVSYPVVVDSSLATWRQYAVRTPPAVVIVAPGGGLYRGWPGGTDEQTLSDALGEIVRR